MGIACGWKKQVIQTNITYAKRTVTRIFSVSPQSRSPFSVLLQTFCLTFRAYLNTQKYRLYNKKSYWDGIKEKREWSPPPPPLEKGNFSRGLESTGERSNP